MFYAQNLFSKFGLRLVHGKADLTSDHQISHGLCIRISHIQHIDQSAAAENGTAVRNLLDLFQLMGDQNNSLAIVTQTSDNLQKKFNLLRSQHGSWFVKDQDLGFPVEHFENFHALLHGDVDLLDHLCGLHFQPEFAGESQDVFVGFLQVYGREKTQSFLHRFHTHNDIFGDRVVAYQFKMLVYHTDIQFCGVIGRLNLYLFTTDDDLAFVWLIHTEKHAHQGGFTGAVFPKECVDFAFFDLDGYIVVGNDAGKTLGDVIHLNNVI